VLEVLCKHLSYMPSIRPAATGQRSARGAAGEQQEFTASDVFSTGYRAPTLNPVRSFAGVSEVGRTQSLQKLLLRWFGAGQQETDVEADDGHDSSDPDDDEVVDRPEAFPSPPPPRAAPTDRDSRRIARLLNQLQTALTSSEFLSERGPEHLAVDLKIVSTLLCAGFQSGWVERQQFLALTQRVWSSLFFSSARQRNAGWLEFLANNSEDRKTFINGMRSKQLSAALIGWYLAVPTDNEPSLATVRFKLAAALAVARLPWLWQTEDLGEIAKELDVLLPHTADPSRNPDEIKVFAEAEWNLLMQRGHALRYLEAVVCDLTPASIRERSTIEELRPGDLLWQGEAGFYIVHHEWSPDYGEEASVSQLGGEGAEVRFKASHIVPIRTLLEEQVVPQMCQLGDRPRKVLHEFIRELSAAFATHHKGP